VRDFCLQINNTGQWLVVSGPLPNAPLVRIKLHNNAPLYPYAVALLRAQGIKRESVLLRAHQKSSLEKEHFVSVCSIASLLLIDKSFIFQYSKKNIL